MAFKFNPFTGDFDLVDGGAGGGGSDNFSWAFIPDGTEVTIPVNQLMVLPDSIEIEGGLNLDGGLYIFEDRPEHIIQTYTADATIDHGDEVVLVDASAGNITITLPAVADVDRGKEFRIKKIDSSTNTVTIDANGAETIDGATTQVLLSQYDGIDIHSDRTEWWIS